MSRLPPSLPSSSISTSVVAAACATAAAGSFLILSSATKEEEEEAKKAVSSVTSSKNHLSSLASPPPPTTTGSSRLFSQHAHNTPSWNVVPLRSMPLLLPVVDILSPKGSCSCEGSSSSSSSSGVNNSSSDNIAETTPPPPNNDTDGVSDFFSNLSRTSTIKKIESTSTQASLESKYNINWDTPLGEGGFGAVYLATDRVTHEQYALKKISKDYTDDIDFQREMNALLHLRANGCHPNICRLKENFNEGGDYYLVLDLICGGELFDHLVKRGPYSEADAARLVREVASALTYLHGIGIVHCDLKPENLMLSSERATDAVIKIVDFGCAEVMTERDGMVQQLSNGTTAFCPPEALDKSSTTMHDRRPSFDMWSLGCILYIMLTGYHPFDLVGDATDEQIEERVLDHQTPPLRDSPLTQHLSDSALDIIEQLLTWDETKRITAIDMLNHPWVKGETAKKELITDSDTKLTSFRAYKSNLEAKVFADMISWTTDTTADDEDSNEEISETTSLIERSYHSLDKERKGFVSAEDLRHLSKGGGKDDGSGSSSSTESSSAISLSEFDDLLSKNMKNKYFSKEDIIYNEGEKGQHMYFINSGTVEVSTEKGFNAQLKSGDFFGEGALLRPDHIRSATVKCITPVHAIEVSQEYFDKYLNSSKTTSSSSSSSRDNNASSGLVLGVREKDKMRKRDMTKVTLSLQKDKLKPLVLHKGEYLYKAGEKGKSMFIVEQGKVDMTVQNKTVLSLGPGDFCGVHSLLKKAPRNNTAICQTDICHVKEMKATDFYDLLNSSPILQDSMKDTWRRRQFQNAIVKKTQKSFPTELELRDAFDAADTDSSGTISNDEVRNLLLELDPTITKSEMREIIKSLDVDESGEVDFDEFKRIFGTDQNKKKSGF